MSVLKSRTLRSFGLDARSPAPALLLGRRVGFMGEVLGISFAFKSHLLVSDSGARFERQAVYKPWAEIRFGLFCLCFPLYPLVSHEGYRNGLNDLVFYGRREQGRGTVPKVEDGHRLGTVHRDAFLGREGRWSTHNTQEHGRGEKENV